MAASPPGNVLPVGHHLGEYHIESILGQGGFGITYRAKDTQLNTLVAIKEYFPQAYSFRDKGFTIVPRKDTSALENYKWGLGEFLKEAQALAKFKHANIVRVLRFLEANNTAYMVMEYEEGESLMAYLKKHGGYLREVDLLGFFLPVLSGLQAVHDAGLLHLDIKPDNIYLRSNGTPMLIDFGSSRQVKGKKNENDKVALTPHYSAIEQYPNIGTPGPWSDVYGMGATLYRCITGKQPVDVMDRYKAVTGKRIDPFIPASKFERPFYATHIRAAVDMALRLSPKQRPQSAYLLQQALMGKDITKQAEVKKPAAFLRQGYTGVIKIAEVEKDNSLKRGFFERLFLSLVFTVLVAVVAIVLLLQTGTLSDEELQAGLQTVESEFDAVYSPIEKKVRKALRLRKHEKQAVVIPTAPQPRPKPVKTVPPFNPDKKLLHTLSGHIDTVYSVVFVKKGRGVVSASIDGVVKLWDVESGKLLRTLQVRQKSYDHIRALNQTVGQEPYYVKPEPSVAEVVTPLPPVQTVDASGAVAAGAAINTTDKPADTEPPVAPEDKEKVQSQQVVEPVLVVPPVQIKSAAVVAASTDGVLVAFSGDNNKITIWDVEQMLRLGELAGHGDVINQISFSPDRKMLVSVSTDKTVALWNLETMSRVHQLAGYESDVLSVAISHNGKRLATGDVAGKIKYWLIESGKPLSYFPANKGAITSLSFSDDGEWLVTSGKDRFLKIWSTGTAIQDRRFDNVVTEINEVRFTPDSKWLVAAANDKSVYFYPIKGGSAPVVLKDHKGALHTVAVSADGKTIASAGSDRKVRIWADPIE